MKIIQFLFILVITFILVNIAMHKSINNYLEQKYHFDSTNDENFSITDLNLSIQQKNNIQKTKKSEKKINILPNEEFLFIGDSLMQGVAISLAKDLKKYNIKSINLSKQSTGLTYKSFFDWNKTTNQAFENNKNIKYLVVLLGANDPWDFRKKGKSYHFNSKEWQEIYAQRINEIINIAKENNATLFWYEIPPVKDTKLNQKLQILNELYRVQLEKQDEIFIQTTQTMSKDRVFSSYVKNENNKSIKIRANDGIHFTQKGSELMSKLLLKYLILKERNEKH
ncbi:DUF459 domain-containing protein [Campylobacter sp. US33a]|uniref:DUF459 domain-containing protein n=1 Tax=Campylobacter sp. CCS1377 TaxID=3158229 RepID=A0AAU7E9K9_9BACT|nr:DUF459 domain-containing protein [Campylobacter sp. US33a]MCW1360980.1 DUF459 domain-containing protein [Campylobacter jejuni]TEY00230.1 DUF459 domain-containing protein [Campylobacter sp. US33a]